MSCDKISTKQKNISCFKFQIFYATNDLIFVNLIGSFSKKKKDSLAKLQTAPKILMRKQIILKVNEIINISLKRRETKLNFYNENDMFVAFLCLFMV